jgi:hypothetical protein
MAARIQAAPDRDHDFNLESDDERHQRLLSEIAIWQSRAGDIAGATLIAKQITAPDIMERTNQTITVYNVCVHAKAGEFGEAATLAATLSNSHEFPLRNYRELAELEIAAARARLGDWPGVLKTMAPLDDSEDKAFHYNEIALEFAKAGHTDEMKKAMAVAAASAANPREQPTSAINVEIQAAALAAAGESQDAIAVVDQSTASAYARCSLFYSAILYLELK